MDEEQLIALAVENWKQIGDILKKKDNHSPAYYNAIGWLLDDVLGSPFRIVASYLAAKDLNSQFDSETNDTIVWNCWLVELGAIVQLQMLRSILAEEANEKSLDVLVSMEIGIELSLMRRYLEEDVMYKLGGWLEKRELTIYNCLDRMDCSKDYDNFGMLDINAYVDKIYV